MTKKEIANLLNEYEYNVCKEIQYAEKGDSYCISIYRDKNRKIKDLLMELGND